LVLQKRNFIHKSKPTFFPPKGQISEAGDSFRPSPLEDGFQPLLSLAEATSSSSTLLISMLSEAVSVPKEEAIGRAWAKNISGTFLLVPGSFQKLLKKRQTSSRENGKFCAKILPYFATFCKISVLRIRDPVSF
jgi:hypothetical protein